MIYKIFAAILLVLGFAAAFSAVTDNWTPPSAQVVMLGAVASFAAVTALGAWRCASLIERQTRRIEQERDRRAEYRPPQQ